MKQQTEERKAKAEKEEAGKLRRERADKAKAAQIKKMYTETKQRAKEIKQRYRNEYRQFQESLPVRQLYQQYDRGLAALFENLSKLEAATKQGNTVTMNYNEYLKMGQKY